MSKIYTSARVSWRGKWLELNAAPLKLGARSFNEQRRSLRKDMASSPFVEGEVAVLAVPGLVTEVVEVYVNGSSWAQIDESVELLVSAFEQLSYQMRVQREDSVVVYSCTPAETTVSRNREQYHAYMAVVTAEVPRQPSVSREVVD